MLNKPRLLALGCGLFMSTAAANQVGFNSHGDIAAQACAYGRGPAAVAQAEAEAASQVAAFLQGAALREFQASHDSLTTEEASAQTQWLKNLQQGVQSGVAATALPLQTGKPFIQGNDTCVAVTLKQGAEVTAASAEGLDWADANAEVAVVVVGEGWPSKQGLSARQVAELDGLKRAVSQVVGVWLQQNFSQYSNSELAQSNDDVTENMRDVVAQQLHSRSDGFVKRWQLLESKPLDRGGVEVTLEAVVAQHAVAAATQDLLQAIGSPRVKVMAPEPLRGFIASWLSSHGIEVSQQANLVVDAQAQLRARGNNQRLAMTVQVQDLSGNLYGQWRNDPSLIALPASANELAQVERDLIDVHLAHEQQAEALQQSLRGAFMQVVAQGGMVREVAIARKYVGSSGELPGILSTIGGVRDVVVAGDERMVSAQLRYNGTAADLASALQQVLGPVLASPLPQAQFENEFRILFL